MKEVSEKTIVIRIVVAIAIAIVVKGVHLEFLSHRHLVEAAAETGTMAAAVEKMEIVGAIGQLLMNSVEL